MSEEELSTADLNVLEAAFNIYLKKIQPKRNDSKEQDKINLHLDLRIVDGNDFDGVLAVLAPAHALRKHNIASREEWLESLTDHFRKLPFDNKFSDHQAMFRHGAIVIGSFPDVEIASFQVDTEDLGITFKLTAKGVDGDAVGKMTNYLNRRLHLQTQRGKHWAEQTALNLEQLEKDRAALKERVDPETKAKIERAKDGVNKRNNEKVRKARKQKEGATA